MKKQINKVEAKKFSDQELAIRTAFQNEINQITSIKQHHIKIVQHFKDPFVMDSNGQMVKASVIYDRYSKSNKIMQDAHSQGNTPYGYAPNATYFNQLNNNLVNNFFLGYAEYAILLQNPMLNKICTVIANEITSKWLTFVYINDVDDKNDAKLKKLEKAFEKFKIKEIINRACFIMFGMGGCQVYPKIDGDEEEIDGKPELENPFVMSNAKFDKGDLKYFKLIEPQYYVPIRWIADDPLNEWFYVPEYYTVLGKVMHQSRMIKFINNELPMLLRPAYMFNGIPLIQQCAPYVQGWESIRCEIITTVSRLNLFKIGTNIEAGIDDYTASQMTASASLPNRLRGIVATLKNGNLLTYDKLTEEIDTVNLTLTGLSDISLLNAEYITSISGIPTTKLFGTPPKGMNSTGEHDLNNWYDTVRNYQANITEHVTTMMHYIMINEFGDIDENITFKWNNLEKANELEEAEIRLKNSQEATAYVNAGVIPPVQVAKKLSNDEDSGWNMLEINEADYERANQVEQTNTDKSKLGNTEQPKNIKKN